MTTQGTGAQASTGSQRWKAAAARRRAVQATPPEPHRCDGCGEPMTEWVYDRANRRYHVDCYALLPEGVA